MRARFSDVVCAVILASSTGPGMGPVAAQRLTLPVAFDRWMYPFNATPGTRATGSVFGALGSPDFDNRDAQVVLGFDLQGAAIFSDRRLATAVVRVTTAADLSFIYDPTHDPLQSYTTGWDADPGRPLELFGVGSRNGFTGLTLDPTDPDPTQFRETSPFTNQSGSRSTRSAFAAIFDGEQAVDVSNHVDEGVERVAWAIGQTDRVNPGDSVPIQTAFEFALPLEDAQFAAYLQSGISRQSIFFALTGLQPASFGGPPNFASFFLDAGGVSLGPTAELELEFIEAVSGDFDGDGLLDCTDIDGLVAEIASGTHTALFDLNGDRLVDGADLSTWLSLAGQANLPSGAAYLPGDANLDGFVDASDFNLWNGHKFTATAAWCQGDFNADGLVDASDFNIWNGHKFQHAVAVTVVPEPGGLGLCLLGSVILILLGELRRPVNWHGKN